MKRTKVFLAMVAATVGILCSACGLGGTNDGEDEYKIDLPALNGSLCTAPMWIAYENGYYEEEGLDVSLISADNETCKIGLNNGTMPVSYGDFEYFQSMESGVKAKVIDGLNLGCIKIVARADSDINSAQDLKGKKIAVNNIGSTPYQILCLWLENAGISTDSKDKEVEILPYDDGNLELQALESGAVEAAAVWDPYGPKAVLTGDVKVLFDNGTDGELAGRYCCFVYGSEKALEEHPEEVAALLRAFHKAEKWISENPDEAIDIIVDKKYAEVDDKEMAKEMLLSYQYDVIAGGEHDTQEDVSYYANWMYEIGQLSTDPEEFTEKYYAKVNLE